MKLCLLRSSIVFTALLVCIFQSHAAGPITRVPNTTLQLPVSPPTFGFTSTNALGLTFTNPICIATPPGETNRLFIIEKRGRIIVVTNLASPTRTVFMNIVNRVSGSDGISEERGLLGLAFHPGYETNRYFYVFYTGSATTTAGSGLHDILARFQTSAVNPNQADTNTEVRLIRQFDDYGNHNGGDIHFGTDGYLYVSLGDEGDANDLGRNSQRIDKDFFSAIMRLDVDKLPGNLPPNSHPATTTDYAIPADNPFIGATNFNGLVVNSNNVRTEFWAVGLRNPWRWSFDTDSGLLYLGDVGQGSREEINIIEKGRNYGWNYWEGFLRRTNQAQIPAGFVHAPPLLNYTNPSAGIAVTGGRVYRGQRLSQLHGAYVYGDYGSGRIWALRHTGTNATQNTLLFSDDINNSIGTAGLSSFGVDPRNGDLLYTDEQNGTNGTVKVINYNTSTNGAPLPPTLADTGAFADLATFTPQPGIVPYELNVPFWSDNAIKSRWFSVPNTNLTIGFNPDANWSFPTGAVWIKHFELELTNGVPSSRKRLETRFIVRNAGGVYGITYRWGNSTTDATLVTEEGLDEPFVVDDGGGIVRTQVWHYPSRIECLRCHTGSGGFALGFNTAQLNRVHDYGGQVTNQILALSLAGYLNTNVTSVQALRSLASATDDSISLEYRVRSYLAANCVQCHQPGGSALALWDARITTTTANAGIINGPLLQNGGNANSHVITPGSLADSMLLARISTRGPNQMPPLASTVVDAQSASLVSAWITNGLSGYQSFADWQIANFGSTNAPDADANADPDTDGANNYLEYLTESNPTNSLDAWKISATLSNDTVEIGIPQVANRAFEVQSTLDMLDANSWLPLNVPGNQPIFPAVNQTAVVSDIIGNPGTKYYRAKIIEP